MKKSVVIRLCVLICLTLVVLNASGVFAAGCEFSLTDVRVMKSRLFTLMLECAGGKSVSAFTAEITYDEEAVEYRSAKILADGAEYSVNSTEKGRLRIVYLCEEGIDCREQKPLMELQFKALQKGEYMIPISVEQVIDNNALPIEVTKNDSATVNIYATTEQSTSKKQNSAQSKKPYEKETAESQTTTQPLDFQADSLNVTQVKSSERDVTLIISSLLAVLVILGMVGFGAYKLGVCKSEKEQIPMDKSSDNKE